MGRGRVDECCDRLRSISRRLVFARGVRMRESQLMSGQLYLRTWPTQSAEMRRRTDKLVGGIGFTSRSDSSIDVCDGASTALAMG
jgi:hypothetical protein